MSFYPTSDLMDGQVSTNDKQPSPIQLLMLKLAIARKKNIQPNKADGFLTTSTLADSEAEGDGSSTTTAPGATPGQQ